MRRRLVLTIATLAIVVPLGAMLLAAPQAAFGVGVLRRDGIIVPFAAFDGKHWIDNWPLPALEPQVPISVRDVPKGWWGPTAPLESWQAWIAGEPKSLRVVQPDWVEAACTRQVGLRTDYKPAQPPPTDSEQPYPKDGLAVSPPQPVEPVAVVRLESAEARALIPMVLKVFNTEERKIEDRYGHPVSRRAREGREPDIEAIYGFGEHPRIYYVEATRTYRMLGHADCAGLAFGTIWFAGEGTQVRELDSAVDLMRCDRVGASYMLPLGVMQVGGKQYWLAQFAGFDHERYVVVEIKRKTVTAVVSAWGGTCER